MVGFVPAIEAFVRRFVARSATGSSTVALLEGYALSYGAYLPILFALLLAMAFQPRRIGAPAEEGAPDRASETARVLLLACIPLAENLLMLQHASQFSYDRLKFAVPAALILSLGYQQFHRLGRTVLIVLLSFAAIQGAISYKRDLHGYSRWAVVDAANRQLARQVASTAAFGCSVLSSNINVRGYANLLFGRGIYEFKSPADSQELIKAKGACANVYIEGDYAFTDLPRYFRRRGSAATARRRQSSI